MPSRQHIALNSWRGIAAVLVALHHFTTTGLITNSLLVANAWVLVDFFFVLSGFIIAATWRAKLVDGGSATPFMVQRFARVYPLHLVMLVLWVLAEAAIAGFAGTSTTGARVPFTGSTAWQALGPQVLLVQAIGLKFDETWNWVAWSISTEFWTYAAFMLLAVTTTRSLTPALAVLALAAAAFVATVPAGSDAMLRWMDFARCLYGFALGALLHVAFVHLDQRRVRTSTHPSYALIPLILELAAIALAVGFLLTLSHVPVHLLAPLVFGAVVLVFAFDAGPVSRALAWQPLQSLALMSYSVYMIHPFVQLRVLKPLGLVVQHVTGFSPFAMIVRSDGVAIQSWGASPVMGDLAALAMLACVFGIAWPCYTRLEEPTRLYGKRWAARNATNPPSRRAGGTGWGAPRAGTPTPG